MSFRIIRDTIFIITQVSIIVANGRCKELNRSERNITEIDICRQPEEILSITRHSGYMYFHTDGLEQQFSLCACQVTSDIDSNIFDVTRRFTPKPNQPFDIYVVSGNVSHVLSDRSFWSLREPIYRDVPWTFLIGKKNLSRDISADARTEYCFLLHVYGEANLAVKCETFPRGEDNQEAVVSVSILVGCLIAVAVIFLACGVGIGFCCKNKTRVHQLKGETHVQDYGDSGIASDGQFGGVGQEVDTSSEYATIDSRKNLHVDKDISEHCGRAETSLNRTSVIMVENNLYA